MMKKKCLLAALALGLLSNVLIAQWSNHYINPVPSLGLEILNSDSHQQYSLTTNLNLNPSYSERFLNFPEYQLLEINLFGTVPNLPIEASLHQGPQELENPTQFDFPTDGTEKLVVHICPFWMDPTRYEFTENYRVDCLQAKSSGEEVSLYADYGSDAQRGVDEGGYPLATTLGGHFKLNGYDNDTSFVRLLGPGQNDSNGSVQDVIGSSFYEIWPITAGGSETLIFSIKKMTKLKKGFATFKEVKRVYVRLNALPPFVPVGSDNQGRTSSSRL